jgi:hypothetical protein
VTTVRITAGAPGQEPGRGVGASPQTGWTGVVAKLLQPRRREREQPEPKDA